MIKRLFYFIRLLYIQKHLIWTLAKREVRSEYVGSIFGVAWSFIQPIVTITVFWVIFSIGFRVSPKNDVPFVVWLTAGMSAWFFFSNITNKSVGCIVGNSHLIKKLQFHSQILPVVKIVSCSISHMIFLFVLFALLVFQDMPVSIYFFQSIYYFICVSVLGLGIGWIVSALNVFIRDTGQFVAVCIQIGFWATPIFWDIEMMPKKLQFWIKLNPIYYIVQGYRESFIYPLGFWHHPIQSLYFWGISISLFIIGAIVFSRLKPHFPDVL